MNVLVIAPHPDDEAIGCGGTLIHHGDAGNRITAVFLTSGELGLKHLAPAKARSIRESEGRAAAKVLSVRKLHFLRQPDWMLGDHIRSAAAALRPILLRELPGLIYVPHAAEWHPDHQAALPILRASLHGQKTLSPVVRAYEVWTPLPAFDHVENITTVMTRKLRAVREHRSQMEEFNYERAVRGLNSFRGELAAKCRYAEVFQSVDINA